MQRHGFRGVPASQEIRRRTEIGAPSPPGIIGSSFPGVTSQAVCCTGLMAHACLQLERLERLEQRRPPSPLPACVGSTRPEVTARATLTRYLVMLLGRSSVLARCRSGRYPEHVAAS